MTSPSRARRGAPRARAAAGPAKQPGAKPDRAAPQPRPFTPRRTLFTVLMIMFALWVAGLLAMYFATVDSSRGRPPAGELAVPRDTTR